MSSVNIHKSKHIPTLVPLLDLTLVNALGRRRVMPEPTRNTMTESQAPSISQVIRRSLSLNPNFQRWIEFAPQVEFDKLHRVVSLAGQGLDLLGGEQLVALLNSPHHFDGRASFLLTDRRLLGHDGQLWDLPFTELSKPSATLGAGVEPLGLIMNLSDGHRRTFTTTPFVGPMATLASYLCHLPNELRREPVALVHTSADDPTGALAAADTVMANEALGRLLELVHQGYEKGWGTLTAGIDLVHRLALQNRCLLMGRGSSRGQWLTSLEGVDLQYLLRRWFGPPRTDRRQDERWLGDYDIPETHWLNAGKRLCQRLRVEVSAGQSVSGFRMWRVADEKAGALPTDCVFRISRAMFPFEQRALALRTAFGWQPSPAALFEQPQEQLEQRISSLGITLAPLSVAA